MIQKKIKKKKQLLAVDFFCCAGGVTCGFRKAGIQVLGGIDIDGAYKKTYERNNPGSTFIQADIAKLPLRSLHRRLGIKKNMDDLIFVGCSPCQYYTNLQTDKTKSTESRLLLEDFKRFVDYYNPGYIFIENVPGLDTKKGSPLANFKEFISLKGFVFDDKIVNAAQYNVPQNRRRYILVASRVKQKISIPSGDTKRIKTVRNTISCLKTITAGYRDKNILKHLSAKLKPINLKRIQSTSHDGGTRLEWKDNPELQLNCYKEKDSTFPDVYGRMYWDQPAPTITTKFHSISNGRFGHPEQDRAISLKEGALLQSFPYSYRFSSDSFITVARMIGNAVPPELAKSIGKSFIKDYQTLFHATKEKRSKSKRQKPKDELRSAHN
jgi:DNA (cytosine-5)-methyltransferase 1